MKPDISTDAIPASGKALPDSDALMRQEEAARLLDVTPRALEAWRYRGGGPQWVAISGRCVRYRKSDLLAFIEERLKSSASEA